MLWRVDDNSHVYVLYLIGESIFSNDGDIAFDFDMVLCLFPRCLDSYEDVLLAKDLTGFEVDLFIGLEDGEIVIVRVLAVAEVYTEVGWVQEEFVDAISEFWRAVLGLRK